jgi:hypothetical protein
LTGSVFFHTDNDKFTGDRSRAQDPLPALQGHVILTLQPGLWVSASAGYGWGGESSVDGMPKNDPKQDFLSAVSLGIPVSPKTGIRLTYVRARTDENIGSDSESVAISLSRRF